MSGKPNALITDASLMTDYKERLLIEVALRMEAQHLAEPKRWPRPTVELVRAEYARRLAELQRAAEGSGDAR